MIDRNAPGKNIADQRPQWSPVFAGTHADGAYAFANLPPGRLVVSARDKHGRVAARIFDAQPGDRLEWDPVLTDELAILGT